MSIQDIREFLKADVPGAEELSMTYSQNGNQVFHIGDKAVEVSPMASNEEIKAAFLNPFIPTQNTKVAVMASPLQGFGQKLAKLKHDTEFDAGKLGSRIDALAARKDAAVTKSHTYLDAEEQHVQDIEQFVTELEQASGNNGGAA